MGTLSNHCVLKPVGLNIYLTTIIIFLAYLVPGHEAGLYLAPYNPYMHSRRTCECSPCDCPLPESDPNPCDVNASTLPYILRFVTDAGDFDYLTLTGDMHPKEARQINDCSHFKPMNLLNLLADKAKAQDTSPDQFYKELQELVMLMGPFQDITVTKAALPNTTLVIVPSSATPRATESDSSPPISELGSTPVTNEPNDTHVINISDSAPIINETDRATVANKSNPQAESTEPSSTPNPVEEVAISAPSSLTDNSAERSTLLRKKYNITFNYESPALRLHSADTVTATRLVMMFPHFLNLGTNSTSSVSRLESSRCFQASVPYFFTCPEFGGLIPRRSGRVSDKVLKQIITVHMYALYGCPDRLKANHARSVVLKCRIEKSLASEDKKCLYLMDMGVLRANGDLSDTASKLYDVVPKVFEQEIHWKKLGFEI